jgi:hypothetical protein|tara:strand:+ start:107 stop:340 length:234 start_codon:yes stop_codon:yes gene_type:complete
MGENMDNVMRMIGDLVSSLTSILVGVIGLGVVAGIVFGNSWFFGDVLANLVSVISSLGDAGLVGLLAAAILIGLLNK